MASVSISMPLGQSPFEPALNLPASTKPIHSRRTSRNPKLTPLPSFSFNPGAGTPQEKEDSAKSTTSNRPAELPAFSFNPGAAMPDESSSPTHPILEEMALNSSRAAPKPFAFNSTEAYKTPSPTKTHFSLESPNPRSGHRRGTSEFIGAEGGLSSSPPKSSLTPPPARPTRSHQHRRSQAVSITEIETSDLIKANAIAKARAGSVPTSPTAGMSRDHFSRASQSISSLYDRTPSTSPPRRASASGARPRVGFSDTVELIPRPLSMISSETEGSVSTIRGGHSLTGSITSLGSPAARSQSSPTFEESSPTLRPRTADAASPRSVYLQSDNHSDSSIILKRPLSATGSTNFSYPQNLKKRYWFGSSTETSPNATPKPTPDTERGDPLSLLTFAPVSPASTQSRPKSSPERNTSLRKRKVRTLAGAIFSRKARSRMHGRGRRTPTPPLSRLSQDMDSVFDDDSTVVLRVSPSPKPDQTSMEVSAPTYEGPFMKYGNAPETATSPIIDLDAALGPFGSEQKLPQYGFAAARSRMHSSIGRGPADVFANAHRRADSAPLMPPVNRAGFSAPSMTSSTNVAAEVFDEEEEDDFLAEESRSEAGTEGSAPKSSPSSEPERTVRPIGSRTSSRSPIGLAISTHVSDGIEIVDVEDISREAARSSDSTLTAPTVSAEDKQQNAPPMQFGYPVPQSSYASSGEGRSAPNSAISSPDADHLHFDQYPRFSRPASERSPDTGIRSSTEDVPSLCDSVSTGNAARFSGGANSRFSADQRSGSFSAPSTSRSTETPKAWKRASLASLNKLLPNATGSKSRLRFEEPAPHEEQERVKKRHHRLSKLMTFWRSKEKEGR